MDKPQGLISLNYNSLLKEQSVKAPKAPWTEQLKKISKDDVIQIAKKIQLDTVFTLKGGDDDDK